MKIKELTKAVSERSGQSQRVVSEILAALADELRGAIARKEDVQLTDIARFKVEHKAARTGRNPKTGEAIASPTSASVIQARAPPTALPCARRKPCTASR